MKRGEVNAALGERGENVATLFLKGQKFRILERNFRCKCGEIDIIARDSGTYVFIEVKTRRNLSFGPPQMAVTPFKQRQISRAALTWLSQNKLHDAPARFDVVGVLLPDQQVPVVEHIRNAFELAG